MVYILWNEQELRTFFTFVYERHSIWHRRNVLGQPWPWTDNRVLRTNKFTNVYRELDPGTIFCKEQILERNELAHDIIFNVMMYRLMCSIPTYGSYGFHRLEDFDEADFDDHLRDIYNSGTPVFGNAYLISPYSSMGSEYKFRNVSRLFGQIHRDFETFYGHFIEAPSFKAAFKVINSLYGMGPFLAYQVMVDLTYPLRRLGGTPLVQFSQNDWAKLGPGAQRGFSRLSNTHNQLQGLIWLYDHQRSRFAEYGLDFPWLLDEKGDIVEISLANFQNCCCEFHKYRSILDGTGKAQRLYNPPVPTGGKRS